jgi:LAO/AO transport system kinase
MVPESGDEIQTMKSGIMEIADIFVVNKSDRPGADQLLKSLHLMLAPAFHSHHELPIIKTIAPEGTGISELMQKIELHVATPNKDRKNRLLAEKAYHLIQARRMRDIDKNELLEMINKQGIDFNLYRFINKY